MPTQVQFRRGTGAQNNSFTGAAGEISIDTDVDAIRVHDGSTAGGFAAAKADLSNINGVGVLTATSFVGSGALLTGVGNTDNIQTATSAVFLSNVNISGVTTCQGLTVSGNLTVDGTTTTINSTTLTVDDKTIVIASGAADAAAANGAGISIDGASATLTYSSSGDQWVSNKEFEAPDFNATSDATLKQDISIIDNALEMINQLEGVSWRWKESLKPSLGVTAQNVEKVVPELVKNGDHKSVNYNGLIGVLIEAVKELKAEVDELKR